ncbi:hypothetical protein EJ03DRAFT_329125 [Teratosphaeria nubilosa]|uniref:Uncharacterized protein n=1 Tax=Teratosphaeria nubilosa TaxID=161662 RepID=A0A6G1L5H6_9PEZI|nr:hypothetical protein EJ03DRAFT_329125 [Teratosphaeria nubilosa]
MKAVKARAGLAGGLDSAIMHAESLALLTIPFSIALGAEHPTPQLCGNTSWNPQHVRGEMWLRDLELTMSQQIVRRSGFEYAKDCGSLAEILCQVSNLRDTQEMPSDATEGPRLSCNIR